MKAKYFIRVLLVLITSLAMLLPLSNYAQAAPAKAPVLQTEDQVTLSMLGYQDQIMNGPHSSFRLRFNTPASWSLLSGASLRLNINSSSTVPLDATNLRTGNTGAILHVSLNNVVLENIFLIQGLQTYDIPIPEKALDSVRLDGRHELRVSLDATIDCTVNHHTTVVVLADSTLSIPHAQVAPTLDLIKLPRPIYQETSFVTETAVIVVSDQPSSAELKAALTVAAGFGRMTAGLAPIKLITSSGLTDSVKANNHVLAVGKPNGLPFLSEAEFPTDINEGNIQYASSQKDDGFLQIALSPWNPTYTLLYVGGNSDAGVVKAAQALSSGVVRTGAQPTLAVISDVTSSIQLPPVAEDRTLASLGYPVQSITGASISSLDYNFYVPPGQTVGADPYFEIVYSHSALMDFSGSGLLVLLNDQAIGSLRFTEETARQVNKVKISIPDNIVHPGNNHLSIQVDLMPLNICSSLSSEGLWMTVNPSSLIHLPLLPGASGESTVSQDLSAYPYPFIGDPSLGEMALVLPKQDPLAWDMANGILMALGKSATGILITPEVVFADKVTEDVRQKYDLLVVGRATQVPLLLELGDWLPAPFSAGSDIANETGSSVSYRIPAGVDIGYIEYLVSPWNPKRAIMVVSGSTPVGLQQAGTALLDPQLETQLGGNYAVVNGTQLITSDTRFGLGPGNLSVTAVPGDYQASPVVPVVINQPADASRPIWLLPVIIMVSALIVVVLGITLIISLRQNRRPLVRK